MELTSEQKQTVERWIKEGCGLSDIQKKLSTELGISMTYMDVRLLMIDLGLKVKDKTSAPASTKSADQGGVSPAGSLSEPGKEVLSRVAVDVDRVTRPGSLVSGTVRFSDGVKASWMLDQFGRLALDAGKKKYTPSEQDLVAFQEELRSVLEKQGF
jgi:hypothetical protein